MADLKVVAQRMNFIAEVGELQSVARLAESKIPLVASLRLNDQDHFVVYRGIIGKCVFIVDPLRGNFRMPLTAFATSWNKNAVLVIAPQGKTSSAVSRLEIRQEELSSLPLNRQLFRQ